MKVKKMGTEKMKAWYNFSSVEATGDSEVEEAVVEQQLGGSDLERDIANQYTKFNCKQPKIHINHRTKKNASFEENPDGNKAQKYI